MKASFLISGMAVAVLLAGTAEARDGHHHGGHHWNGHHHRHHSSSFLFFSAPIYSPPPVAYYEPLPPPPVEEAYVEPQEEDQYCREYQSQVRVGGRWQETYGTACMDEGGDWRIVD